MLPKHGPNPFPIRLGNFYLAQFRAREEFKNPFPMRRGKRFQAGFYFEQKHQPVRLALVAVFTNEADQVQVVRLQ